ncbi:MAG: hypothetical protein ACFBZ8_13805 [Opitutales bacterium]
MPKNKTVGVSLPPELRQQASDRAHALGLTFSRYVALCLEAEIQARPPRQLLEALPGTERPVDLERALDEGSEYGAAKAAAIAFEDDIEDIIRTEQFDYERFASVAHLRTDFLVRRTTRGKAHPRQIALECKHTVRQRYTVTLGQSIILKSLPTLHGVVLCVPYTRNFDPHVRDTFAQHGIPVVTPDSLPETLNRLLKKS